MTVNDAERNAMARLLEIMNGNTASVQPVKESYGSPSSDLVELPGAGNVTQRDIQAMAAVLEKFNSAVTQTQSQLMTESVTDSRVAEALVTEKQTTSIRIGHYKIAVRMDESRVAGKQYYDVIHGVTGEKLASELSLYEAAHGLVRLLNAGKYVNSQQVRDLLEAEASYTGHRIDAIHFHKMARKAHAKNLASKADLYEDRKAASMDRAAQAKATLKKLYNDL